MPDHALLDRARSGDVDAFAELTGPHRRDCTRTANQPRATAARPSRHRSNGTLTGRRRTFPRKRLAPAPLATRFPPDALPGDG